MSGKSVNHIELEPCDSQLLKSWLAGWRVSAGWLFREDGHVDKEALDRRCARVLAESNGALLYADQLS